VTPVANQPGQFDVRISRATALPAGTLKLLSLIADVPATAALGKASVIATQDVRINGAQAPQAGDAAIQAVAYLGDLNLDGKYDAADVALLGRLGTKLDSGLAALNDIDPLIAADIDGNGVLNAIDTALLTLRTRTASTPVIPALPVLPPAPSASTQQVLPTSGSATPATQATGARTVNLNGIASSFVIKRNGTTTTTTTATKVLPATAALSAIKAAVQTASAGATGVRLG
jgi:hypothetical protein